MRVTSAGGERIVHPNVPTEVVQAIDSGRLESLDALELLAFALDTFSPRLALSASFGSPEGMVILDLMHKLRPGKARVFTIDTGRLPQATHNLMDRVRDRYGVEIEVFFPDAERVQKMVREHGQNLFYETPEKRQLCCGERKVEPLGRALSGLDAWIAGLRAEHSRARESARAVEIDTPHGGRVKFNPLVRWSRDRVADHVRDHRVPTNALHQQGYPSIGCEPCSRAIRPGEPERAGRWWWENDDVKECGIHSYEERGSGI